MIRLVLVRHGHTALNTPEGQGQYFRGMTDLPLAEEGVAQAKVTARRMSQQRVDAFYTSPLQRAARTAQILAEPHNMAVTAVPGLSSMSYGDWAGLLSTEVARRWPDLYEEWRRDPFSIRVPGGDSVASFRERVVGAVHEILDRHSDGECVVLVSHEAVCRTLVCALSGLPNHCYWRIRQGLCNLTKFDYDPAGHRFTLVEMNDTCHLDRFLPRARGNGTRVVLVRHGQTAWNEGAGEERFRGRTDLPLDGTGLAQASALTGRLRSEPIDVLYTSPLTRARQTIAPLADDLGLPIHSHQGLIDIDYGEFQGRTHREAAAAYPDLYALWRSRPGLVHFPRGEGLANVRERFLGLLDELAAAHPGQTVALSGHQMVNKVAVCTLLELDLDQIWRVQQDPCRIDVFQQVDGAWHTLQINDACHLG
jgi:probable phosphoglycerate mutase